MKPLEKVRILVPHSVKTCGITWGTKLLVVGFGGVSHIAVHRLGLV